MHVSFTRKSVARYLAGAGTTSLLAMIVVRLTGADEPLGPPLVEPQISSYRFSAIASRGWFVYHCHILEHEDGGTMANILVQPRPRP